MHKMIVCLYCEAEYNIKHSMDENSYMVAFCPFCGEDLENSEEYDFEYIDEYEDE